MLSLFPSQPLTTPLTHNRHNAICICHIGYLGCCLCLSCPRVVCSEYEYCLSDIVAQFLLSHRSAWQARRHWFTVKLFGRPKSGNSVSFTVKFRSGKGEAWKWANDQFSVGDGQLYYQPASFDEHDLSHYISGISSDLTVRRVASDTPKTSLWSIKAPVKAASGDDSGRSSHKLGIPNNYSRWVSIVRLWTPWLAPRHGREKFRLDKDGILCAFLRRDGLHVVILGISGIDDVLTVFNHDDEGNVVISGRNDREEKGASQVVVAVGASFEVANAAVMYHARRLVSGYEAKTGQEQSELAALMDQGYKPQWLEDWYDGFAYCTWNGLGQALTEDKIYDALDSLRKNDIHITNLIIDDNWQTLDQEGENQSRRAWLEFEANKQGFPLGLRHTVSNIRAQHKNVKHIAVWHAMLGYWGGISPHGKIAKEYKTTKVRKPEGVTGSEWTVIDAEDVDRFYNDFYQFLSSSGIDSVKTDAQFSLDEFTSARDRRHLIQAYQDAWLISSLRHFAAKAISCMSQAPQILFHSQLPTNKPRLLVRNSDDFFPEIPASHPWHIFCNAHNSLFTQHLNVLPDWDMFQTHHPWAAFHAAARCVSGGPIYFTDTPGKHDIDLIRQMTARTPRGNTVILRPDTVGKTTQAYIGYEEQALLKVETYVGRQRTGTGILGVFNVCQRPLTELVRLDEFPGTGEGNYIVRSHRSGQINKPMRIGGRHAFVCAEVDVQGWEILSAFPLREFELQRKEKLSGSEKVAVANLGLLGKMTGAAAVVSADMYMTETGRLRIRCSLKALGTFGK